MPLSMRPVRSSCSWLRRRTARGSFLTVVVLSVDILDLDARSERIILAVKEETFTQFDASVAEASGIIESTSGARVESWQIAR